MNRIMKKLALSLTAVLTAGGVLAGCGSSQVALEDYPTTVVATFGDTNIYLDEANYLARTEQYNSEMYYSMIGYDISTMWDTELGSKTLEAYTKESVMTAICQTLVLDAKAEDLGISLDEEDQAKVEEAVSGSMEEIPRVVKDATNITEELLTEIITKNALANKVYAYAVQDVDTEVSDEEAAQRTISYILVTDGDDADAAAELAEELKTRVEDGETMSEDMVADYDNCTYSQTTYGEGDYDNTLGDFGLTLETGEVGTVYEDGYGWYVVYCDTDFDEEATEAEKDQIVETRRTELFQSTYEEWLKDMPEFKVDEDVWEQVSFDDNLYVAETESTEASGDTTAAADETESETETAAEDTAADTTAASDGSESSAAEDTSAESGASDSSTETNAENTTAASGGSESSAGDPASAGESETVTAAETTAAQ